MMCLQKKTWLSADDDKRIQTLNGVISFSYGAGAGIVCQAQLIEYTKKKTIQIGCEFLTIHTEY